MPVVDLPVGAAIASVALSRTLLRFTALICCCTGPDLLPVTLNVGVGRCGGVDCGAHVVLICWIVVDLIARLTYDLLICCYLRYWQFDCCSLSVRFTPHTLRLLDVIPGWLTDHVGCCRLVTLRLRSVLTWIPVYRLLRYTPRYLVVDLGWCPI